MVMSFNSQKPFPVVYYFLHFYNGKSDLVKLSNFPKKITQEGGVKLDDVFWDIKALTVFIKLYMQNNASHHCNCWNYSELL